MPDALRVPDNELEFGPDLVMFYRGDRFTGVSYEDEPDGGLCELTYVDGLQHGPAREWDGSGRLRSEEQWQENVRHGLAKTFDESGAVESEQWWDRDRRVNHPPARADLYVGTSVNVRLAGSLLAVRRWLGLVGIHDPGLDELVEHLWHWPIVRGRDEFVAWDRWSSPVLEAALGGDIPADLSRTATNSGVELHELHDVLMAMVGIVYNNLYADVDDAQTLTFLSRVEAITAKRGVVLPPPRLFGHVPFSEGHGWGALMTQAEIEHWRRLTYD